MKWKKRHLNLSMSWQKQHSSPQSAQIFWISKQVLFCFQFAYTSYVNIFLPQPSHFEYNSCTWYLWKDFRLIGDFLFKVYFLRTSFPLKKTSRSHVFFFMVKPEVKTWMCHLQDLVINGSSMKVPPFFNLELLLIGVVKSWILGKIWLGVQAFQADSEHLFYLTVFLWFEIVWTFIPPKTNPSWCHFIMAIGLTLKGLPNASFHFSNPNSLDWFLTPRHLAWSFQHHLAHLSNGF